MADRPSTADLGGAFHPLGSWVCLAGLTMGFLLPLRAAVMALLGFALITAVNLSIAWHGVVPSMTGTSILLTVIGVALGTTVVAARTALNSVVSAQPRLTRHRHQHPRRHTPVGR